MQLEVDDRVRMRHQAGVAEAIRPDLVQLATTGGSSQRSRDVLLEALERLEVGERVAAVLGLDAATWTKLTPSSSWNVA